jgi:RNA polymerase sigma-70 factor (ECF subfamily)
VQGEKTNAEIASILGVSEGAAEQLLVRARRTLRTMMEEKESVA